MSLLVLVITHLFASESFAQTAMIRGQVTDESGAIIPSAVVSITSANGAIRKAAADNSGTYSVAGLTPGEYQVSATAPQLSTQQSVRVSLGATPVTINLVLKVVANAQKITVEENTGPALSVETANNASGLILRGDDLMALSDDPTDLMADLLALAGPSAGPNGGSIFIDGFSGGELPDGELR